VAQSSNDMNFLIIAHISSHLYTLVTIYQLLDDVKYDRVAFYLHKVECGLNAKLNISKELYRNIFDKAPYNL